MQVGAVSQQMAHASADAATHMGGLWLKEIRLQHKHWAMLGVWDQGQGVIKSAWREQVGAVARQMAHAPADAATQAAVSSQPRIPNHKPRNPKPETLNPKHFAPHFKLEAAHQELFLRQHAFPRSLRELLAAASDPGGGHAG